MKHKINISKSALYILNIGLPIIATAFAAMLVYILTHSMSSSVAVDLVERGLGLTVIVLLASFIVNFYQFSKSRE